MTKWSIILITATSLLFLLYLQQQNLSFNDSVLSWLKIQQVANTGDTKDLLQSKKRDILDYLHWKNENQCLVNFYFGGHLHQGNGRKGLDGQKNICMDPGIAPNPNDCLIYSFGINNEWSVDDIMEKYGCSVFSFDPSMGRGNHSHSARVQFFNLGLGTENIAMNRRGWRMATLERIRQDLGHSNRTIDYLKMDIEGAEWQVLPQLLDTNQLTTVKQIGLEIHVEDGPDMSKYQHILEELEQSKFVRFSSSPNYFVPRYFPSLNRSAFNCYEITWFNSNFSHTNSV